MNNRVVDRDRTPTSTRRFLDSACNGVFNEARIAYRLNVHNVWVAALPPLLFAAAAWRVAPPDNPVLTVATAVIWSYLFVYIFDAANQAAGVDEDRINKPKRPAPMGLVDAHGLRLRCAVGSVLFVSIGLAASVWTGTISAVWVATIVVVHKFMPARMYFAWKPFSNFSGAVTQLTGGWAIVGPLNGTAVTWALILSVMVVTGMPIEDVRDVDGDVAAGRRSLPMMLGARSVAAVFAALMAAWPFIGWALIVRHVDLTMYEACSLGLVFVLSYAAGLSALNVRSMASQKRAYILYSLVHVALTALPLATLVR
jgi:4-hydroxybenzoate polyprenyltransferase